MDLFNELCSVYDKDIVDQIEIEYKEFIDSFINVDFTKSGINTGRLCELFSLLLAVKENGTVKDLNQIHFDPNITSLISKSGKTPEQEITCLILPRVLQSLYTIRNKKKIAHFKENLPNKIDLYYLKEGLDFILSQLAILHLNLEEKTINDFLESFLHKDLEFIEKFEDGGYYFYDDSLSWSDKILFFLYSNYPEEKFTRREIENDIKMKKNYISTYINNLISKQLIYENSEGIIISQKGIRYIKIKLKGK